MFNKVDLRKLQDRLDDITNKTEVIESEEIAELEAPIKEEDNSKMPFGEAIYQYVDEDESSGDARLYLDGNRLIDDVRFMLEKDNPDVEIIALSESKD